MTSQSDSQQPVTTANPLAIRFVFVDGLRGLAALSIVIFHIWWYEPAPYPALDNAHWIYDAAFLRLRGGVQTLLVISGFVIAYTLRNTWVDSIEVLRFVSRRFVRLVPAYWTAIAIALLVNIACSSILNLPSYLDNPVTSGQVLSHLVFLQELLGYEALSAGMWTVCIEVQFYMFAVVAWGLAQRLFTGPEPNRPRPSAWGLISVFAPLALISLFIWRRQDASDVWVAYFFWTFFLGMATWWALEQSIRPSIFWGVVCIAIVELIINREPANAVALMTALLLLVAGQHERLGVWLNWGWLQYLGRISYSLYLIHFPVCHLVTATGWKLYGENPTSMQAVFILFLALVASIPAAHLLYMFVEAPSIRWTELMKRRSVAASTFTAEKRS